MSLMNMKLFILRPSSKRCLARAFTLTELLVVIGIIAVLAVLLFPMARKSIDSAQTAKCMSHQRQIVSAILSYTSENGGYLPSVAPRWGEDNENNPYWTTVLVPYLGGNSDSKKTKVGLTYLRCPAEKDLSKSTYGVNYTEKLANNVITFSSLQSGYPGSASLGKISGKNMLLMDALGEVVYNPEKMPLNNGDRDSNSTLVGLGMKYNNAAFDRHKGKAMACFADGSARSISLDEWRAYKPGMW